MEHDGRHGIALVGMRLIAEQATKRRASAIQSHPGPRVIG
jgi:hypothetical protein